jgi:hypothetical protein
MRRNENQALCIMADFYGADGHKGAYWGVCHFIPSGEAQKRFEHSVDSESWEFQGSGHSLLRLEFFAVHFLIL